MTVVVVAVALLLGVGSAPGRAAVPNVLGSVTRGPVTPVCQKGVRCDEPAVGVVLVFSRTGMDVARVVARSDGRFALFLRPGTYVVRQARRLTIGPLIARSFRVVRGSEVVLRLAIDTGIR